MIIDKIAVVNLFIDEEVNSELLFNKVNCNECNLLFTNFKKTIVFNDSFVDKLVFTSCVFESNVIFFSNQIGTLFFDCCRFHSEFHLFGNTFSQEVNFYDCYFGNQIFISDNKFLKGTNLFGNTLEPFANVFKSKSVLGLNIGNLDNNFR